MSEYIIETFLGRAYVYFYNSFKKINILNKRDPNWSEIYKFDCKKDVSEKERMNGPRPRPRPPPRHAPKQPWESLEVTFQTSPASNWLRADEGNEEESGEKREEKDGEVSASSGRDYIKVLRMEKHPQDSQGTNRELGNNKG